MKWFISALAVIFFGLGGVLGFVSSPDYHNILKYGVICEVLALMGFTFWIVHANGVMRLLPGLLGVLSFYVLVEALQRLAYLASQQ